MSTREKIERQISRLCEQDDEPPINTGIPSARSPVDSIKSYLGMMYGVEMRGDVTGDGSSVDPFIVTVTLTPSHGAPGGPNDIAMRIARDIIYSGHYVSVEANGHLSSAFEGYRHYVVPELRGQACELGCQAMCEAECEIGAQP